MDQLVKLKQKVSKMNGHVNEIVQVNYAPLVNVSILDLFGGWNRLADEKENLRRRQIEFESKCLSQ